MSNSHYSFGQWCLDNERQDLLDRWNNSESPFEVSFQSNKKYHFICPNHLHEDVIVNLYDISTGKNKTVKCRKCNSFGQFITDKFGEEHLNKIWSDKNEFSPFDVAKGSSKKAWFICQKNPEHIYDMQLYHYYKGVGCPYCSGNRVSPEMSLGGKHPNVIDLWSEQNDKTPFEYAPFSNSEVWFKCENGLHEDYKRLISSSNASNFRCPKCAVMFQHDKTREDVTNKKFGELTALYFDRDKTIETHRTYWVCECDCGAFVSVPLYALKSGNTTTCGNRTIHYSGENSGYWKGGTTPELVLARNNSFYDKWRDSVYAKDWYTCQCCGKSKGINKEAHHLIGFANNPELRYEVSNGITLCDKCHAFKYQGSFHSIYGTKDNTPEQLEEFINNKRKSLGIDVPFYYEEYIKGNVIKPNELSSKPEELKGGN